MFLRSAIPDRGNDLGFPPDLRLYMRQDLMSDLGRNGQNAVLVADDNIAGIYWHAANGDLDLLLAGAELVRPAMNRQ